MQRVKESSQESDIEPGGMKAEAGSKEPRMTFDDAYYVAMQNRTAQIVTAVVPWLSVQHTAYCLQLVDANEFGVALELMGWVLSKQNAQIESNVAHDFRALATEIGMPEAASWIAD